MTDLACQVLGIVKSFGPNKVLREVDLDLPAGKVTVLMGANGAGKSTLVNILCGVHAADTGSMTLFGKSFWPDSPADAFQSGVVTVHQSINNGVIPDLDVASNLMIDRLAEKTTGFFINSEKLRQEALEVASTMDLDVDVKACIRDLGLADRQMIAIARAMTRNPKLLILDEPTSSLSANEAQRLFKLLETLKDQGVAILYISHRMSDIRSVADRIVTMRDGKISGIFEDALLDYEGAVSEREQGIRDALASAVEARKEMENLQADNERILKEARVEREAMLKEARELKNKMTIIMMSSLKQEDIIIESIAVGAIDFLQKPFEKETLIKSVKKAEQDLELRS